MNKTDCQQLIDAYSNWLRKGLVVDALESACELTTPFLDRHNDHIQIYAVRKGGKIVLSDDGYVLSDLRTSGLDVATPKRKSVLDSLLNGFGVHTDGRQLHVEASTHNLGPRVHSLVQAMLAVNDMFVMAQPRVAGFFLEDVRSFLTQHEIRHSPKVKLSGRSGFDHLINFLIPKSPSRPERIVQAISAPNRNNISTFLFALADTREGRGEDSEAYAFLNNRDQDVGGDVMEALEAYEVIPALWSEREEYVAALAG